MIIDDLADHLTNRQRLAFAALAVACLEPVKAADHVVGQSLPRKQQRDPALLGERGPAGSDIVVIW